MKPERLVGQATREGTKRGAESFGEGARTLGRTGLVVSPIGFGGHRIRADEVEHRRALALALEGGVNVVDAGRDEGDARSETLVGLALAQAVQQGSVRREQIVVVGHCDPEHPRAQLDESLARLGLEHVDVLLVHPRGEHDDRLREAFTQLEALARAGAISWYGVASDGLAQPEHAPTYTSLPRLVALAREIGGDDHRLGVVQLPLNLLELGAATCRHAREGGRTTLEIASAADLGVLVRRPLDGHTDDARVRLADPLGDDTGVLEALAVVRKLEGVWADALGKRIVTEDGNDNAIDLFRWGQELARAWRQLDDRARWQSLRHDIIAKQLGQASAALLANLAGDDREAFARWWQSYGTAMHGAFTAIEAWLERPPSVQARIARALDPLLPTPWRELPLSRKAVLVALSTPIGCALVGMRRPSWVADMLALREHPVRLLSAATGPVAIGELQARLSRVHAGD